MSTTIEKLEQLRHWFNRRPSVLVAYSGGVDSALVMAVAHGTLGPQALACIGVSPSYPVREMRQAVKLAEQLKLPYRLVDTEEHLDENYALNASNRCYFCKHELYGKLRRIADDEGWDTVADGTNQSDQGDDRPGTTAARQHGVRSPLAELSLTKDQVRQLAQTMNLPVWDKPAMACLSSRVPHGTSITPQLLRQIEAAEDTLFELDFEQFRVRHHGQVALVELMPDDMASALANRQRIVAGIRRAGYQFVCLDLAGFRSGSLNAADGTVAITVEGT